jgi:DNA-binding CsgD family transcriptional regulator
MEIVRDSKVFTAYEHMLSVYCKLQVHTRSGAVAKALKAGLV